MSMKFLNITLLMSQKSDRPKYAMTVVKHLVALSINFRDDV